MPGPILPISQPVFAEFVRPGSSPSRPGTFQNVLEQAVGSVEQMRGEANQAVQKFLTGQDEELHTAALATQKAELAFELGLQVRNKVVQAYQQIMQMQV